VDLGHFVAGELRWRSRIKAAGSAVTNTPGIVVVENWFEELKRLVPTTR
jgi:hypothetical protein